MLSTGAVLSALMVQARADCGGARRTAGDGSAAHQQRLASSLVYRLAGSCHSLLFDDMSYDAKPACNSLFAFERSQRCMHVVEQCSTYSTVLQGQATFGHSRTLGILTIVFVERRSEICRQ